MGFFQSTSLTVWGPHCKVIFFWYHFFPMIFGPIWRAFCLFQVGGRPTTPTFHWCVLFTWPYALFFSSVCIASSVCNIGWIILFSWFVSNDGSILFNWFFNMFSYFCNGWIHKKWFILFMVPISCFSHRIGFVVTIQLFNTNPRVWLPSNWLLIFLISDSSSEHCTKRLGYLASIGIWFF